MQIIFSWLELIQVFFRMTNQEMVVQVSLGDGVKTEVSIQRMASIDFSVKENTQQRPLVLEIVLRKITRGEA